MLSKFHGLAECTCKLDVLGRVAGGVDEVIVHCACIPCCGGRDRGCECPGHINRFLTALYSGRGED
jgi:hypothetical protein